jgi:hypothetical protein
LELARRLIGGKLTLFDGTSEHPESRLRRYAITGIVFVLLVWGGAWYMLRFHSEKAVVRNFFTAVVAGQTDTAYRIWHPQPGYSLKDFLEDWGTSGYYGPVRSFRLSTTAHPTNASGVVVVVEVSPSNPFPTSNDAVGQASIKEVKLWVEFKDHSLSFAP